MSCPGANFTQEGTDYFTFTCQGLTGGWGRSGPFFFLLNNIIMIKSLPISDQCCRWVLTVCQKVGKALSHIILFAFTQQAQEVGAITCDTWQN